uniref:UDP-N-acetylglucosamine--dolichyl-phosphate N-acetylglucosaminephosphotransferase n=1 Tax=Caligus rogercresseyi TaxID=217165 RepID=C1BNB5_CALRO|nr:UDP-N-acetylglucosamine--dolichyl-phosphate N-acetylglucosaminephosphotransferase [Caligus rogercresseyi]
MKIPLEVLSGASLLGFFLTLNIIPNFRESFLKANLFGCDLNKRSGSKVPEAGGVLSGCVFLIITITCLPSALGQYLVQKDAFPHEEFARLLAALLSISAMLLLGFVDDVLDLKWRHKLALPSIASLPLLVVYYVVADRTDIVVPLMFRPLMGTYIDLGFLYYLYIGLLAVFCTNAINILSGINGLEVGQAVLIAASVGIFNLREINGPLGDYHRFSLYFILPFISTSLALLYYNWYPARVFCGDTFCYFSGMTLAVVAILGHFSKTLLLFFVPQVLNFLLSTPQLFKLLPCPRHRLPKYDPDSDTLSPSRVALPPQLSPLGALLLRVLSSLRLIRYDEKAREVSNLTLPNLCLLMTGPIFEVRLTLILLSFQVACSMIAFLIRYPLALLLYGEVVA